MQHRLNHEEHTKARRCAAYLTEAYQQHIHQPTTPIHHRAFKASSALADLDKWVVDSGCTQHLTHTRKDFLTFHEHGPTDKPFRIHGIGGVIHSKGRGTDPNSNPLLRVRSSPPGPSREADCAASLNSPPWWQSPNLSGCSAPSLPWLPYPEALFPSPAESFIPVNYGGLLLPSCWERWTRVLVPCCFSTSQRSLVWYYFYVK